MIVTYVLVFLLLVSISVNVLLFRKRKKPQKTESLELREFLTDLMGGDALLHIRRVSPSDVYLKVGNR